MEKVKHHSIERIDYTKRGPAGKSQSIHAWEVFLRVNGERRVKIFSDSKFGGKKKALRAAISYRDACMLTYKNMSSITTSHRRLGLVKHRGKTEDIGVSLSRDRKVRSDGTERVTLAWKAQWVDAVGKHHSKGFSIPKYGDEEAYRLAKEAREAGMDAKRKELERLGYFHSVPHALDEPDDPDIKVWRYMDFTKLVSTLIHSSLFFAKVDNLDDPFEGAYSLPNVLWRDSFYKGDGPTWEELDTKNKDVRQKLVVNCWHMSEYESAAMWKLYSKSNEAICVQSTYRKLKQSLAENSNIVLGRVQYINYEWEMIPEGNYHYPYLYKRKSFEHERELRAIKTLDHNLVSDGVFVKVDLKQLIERIYVAPSSEDWFKELVESVLNHFHFGLPMQVERSQLDAMPLEGMPLT